MNKVNNHVKRFNPIVPPSVSLCKQNIVMNASIAVGYDQRRVQVREESFSFFGLLRIEKLEHYFFLPRFPNYLQEISKFRKKPTGMNYYFSHSLFNIYTSISD